MSRGKAYGADRDYQVLCRDILIKRFSRWLLLPCAGDGIDVAFELGGTMRTFDVALTDVDGRLVVAECRRTKKPVKLLDLDAFAYRVELLRKSKKCEVAGIYFTKTAYQAGAVRAGDYSGIEVAVCAPEQPLSSFSLMFHRYDADRNRRLRRGEGYFEGHIKPEGSLFAKVTHPDGSVEDLGRIA